MKSFTLYHAYEMCVKDKVKAETACDALEVAVSEIAYLLIQNIRFMTFNLVS